MSDTNTVRCTLLRYSVSPLGVHAPGATLDVPAPLADAWVCDGVAERKAPPKPPNHDSPLPNSDTPGPGNTDTPETADLPDADEKSEAPAATKGGRRRR